ncbi:MAG: hypothetical protein LAT58_08290, partial [Opitutales bacterium]|nr:hypothetical protein [Opitutales bacterium]
DFLLRQGYGGRVGYNSQSGRKAPPTKQPSKISRFPPFAKAMAGHALALPKNSQLGETLALPLRALRASVPPREP